MPRKTLLIAIVLAVALVAAGVALRGDGGRVVSRWFASMHGAR